VAQSARKRKRCWISIQQRFLFAPSVDVYQTIALSPIVFQPDLGGGVTRCDSGVCRMHTRYWCSERMENHEMEESVISIRLKGTR
jgi:hypothetical protein